MKAKVNGDIVTFSSDEEFKDILARWTQRVDPILGYDNFVAVMAAVAAEMGPKGFRPDEPAITPFMRMVYEYYRDWFHWANFGIEFADIEDEVREGLSLIPVILDVDTGLLPQDPQGVDEYSFRLYATHPQYHEFIESYEKRFLELRDLPKYASNREVDPIGL